MMRSAFRAESDAMTGFPRRRLWRQRQMETPPRRQQTAGADVHLAQLNIARLRYPGDDPRVADFMDNLDRVNALAERSEGFVWRLKDEAGNATEIQAFDDDMIIVNMSVWRDAESLEHFVWNTVHKQFYRRRAEWFSLMDKQHLVMWW